ncbi:16S rRNA (cytosine(1402)-N(4))-methyltransferase [Candidatus Wolfebacteria bacterium]|nr:MAG: 16S rRNA (cytosine(1402)-N(4))-methyltransferase [Candidatus Wolfebacteria bacterium]
MHISVLLDEVIDGLDLKPGDVYLDGTAGSGGHARAVCEALDADVKIIALDADFDALKRTTKVVAEAGCTAATVETNYRNLDEALDTLGIKKVDKILFDLGLSSNQLENSQRGFSFQHDEPLLMTFADSPDEYTLTAQEIVNTWDEENIADIIYGYGDEGFSRRIAKGIVDARKQQPIKTTFDLVKVIEDSVPFFYKHKRIHPATKTFQALRTTVNDEIESLKDGMRKGFERLEPHGRLAIIAFHSKEDRIVKNYFRDMAKDGVAKLITKKPITPGSTELKNNPRARSAKLRILEKL